MTQENTWGAAFFSLNIIMSHDLLQIRCNYIENKRVCSTYKLLMIIRAIISEISFSDDYLLDIYRDKFERREISSASHS